MLYVIWLPPATGRNGATLVSPVSILTLSSEMPKDFVYLRDVDPTIEQDMRYASANNFTGAKVPGYDAPECVLVRQAAEAFINFLWSEEAQRGFARYGLRPVDQKIAEEVKAQFPSVEDLWKIEYLGGWKRVTEEIYGPQGVYSRVTDELRKTQ